MSPGLHLYLYSAADKNQEPSSPKERYSTSSTNIDKSVLLGSDLAKTSASTAIAKKYSLPPRTRHDVPQIEARARTRSVDNEHQEAYDNLGVSSEASDDISNVSKKKISLTNRLESPFYTEPLKKDSQSFVPSIKARYGRPKKKPNPNKEEIADANSNDLPAIKDGELRRKGSIVLVSKSLTGETCFQVQTPVELKKMESSKEIINV